jgi:hypothetical protein
LDNRGLPRAKTLTSNARDYRLKDSYFDHEPKIVEKSRREIKNIEDETDTNIFDQSLCNDLQRLLNEDDSNQKRKQA